MGVIIRESGMEFGEYDENQVFRIEASEQYTKSLRQNGIKSCEFILRRGTISISSRQNLHVQDRSCQVFHPMRKRRRKKRMTSI